jgi:hypothetical protein
LAEAGGSENKPISIVADRAGILSAIKKAVLEKDDAFAIVAALREKGLIDIPIVAAGKGNIKFIEYLKEFWDYEKSPYVRDKLAHGHSIGRHHCKLNHFFFSVAFFFLCRVSSIIKEYINERWPVRSFQKFDHLYTVSTPENQQDSDR